MKTKIQTSGDTGEFNETDRVPVALARGVAHGGRGVHFFKFELLAMPALPANHYQPGTPCTQFLNYLTYTRNQPITNMVKALNNSTLNENSTIMA